MMEENTILFFGGRGSSPIEYDDGMCNPIITVKSMGAGGGDRPSSVICYHGPGREFSSVAPPIAFDVALLLSVSF